MHPINIEKVWGWQRVQMQREEANLQTCGRRGGIIGAEEAPELLDTQMAVLVICSGASLDRAVQPQDNTITLCANAGFPSPVCA